MSASLNATLFHSMRNASNVSYTGSFANRQNTIFMGYLYLMLTVYSYVSNAVFLFIYGRTPSLQSPFSVYVVSLSVCDLCKSLTNSILKVTNNFQAPWLFGDIYCLLSQYSAATTTSIMMYLQVLISVNRLWAVAFPNNYRTAHNKKVAVGLIMAVVVFINAWALPDFLLDLQKERSTKQIEFCSSSYGVDQTLYDYFYGAILHLLPQAIVIVLYPFIYFKVKGVLHKRAKIGMAKEGHSVEANGASLIKPTDTNPTTVSATSGEANDQSKVTTGQESQKRSVKQPKAKESKQLTGTRHFGVLTTLLISATLLWTPTHLAYILMMTGKFVNYSFLGVANFLFALDGSMNPLLCVLASKEWRSATKKAFRRS
ncbi:5-hydroxytryptamine receptor 1D-like [Paramacrobiotus metropolitanus]|uniref:5-hydroxytryptamine receptor 1D-like n=1 Tax=Paramacrobiotus metropolitanus TaxID=2943436 RepID=UPI0024457CDA|nr:5-hydroxytryptamine receptor 1D-like [Paramacrobiotus metropolitanus]